MVVEGDAAEVVVEAAVVVVEVVEAAVIVTDPVRIAAMTAAKTVEIVETAGTVVLVPTVAQEDPEEEEAEAVEARKNSAWTRRLSPLWARLPLKVRPSLYQIPDLESIRSSLYPSVSHCNLFQVEESKKFQTTTFSSRANNDY